jgi:hypothetical protein
VQAYNITQVSLRQSIVPPRLQARMNATVRFLVWGRRAVRQMGEVQRCDEHWPST